METPVDPIERLRAYYAAFNAKDWEAMFACVHDDVVHHPNQGTAREGKAAFREFVLHNAKAYDEQLTEVMLFASEDGKRAAAEFKVNGTYLQADPGFPSAHGQKYTLPCGAFFEFKDGAIARISNYYNLEDWIAQVRG
jgi:steroid delta-isomerase-like uncharacterized protein